MSERPLQTGRDDAWTVSLATQEDVDVVAGLLVALDQHYLGPGGAPPAEAARAMVARTLEQREGTHFAVGRLGDRPVALACFARVRPGHLLQGVLWLKDLFVVEEARGRGLGQAMLAFLAEDAARHGLGRIDLTTERDNAGAQRFYERMGAAAKPKVFYRFEGEALAGLRRARG